VSGAFWKWFHLVATILWIVLTYPSVFVWGKMLEYITFLSVYAIVISHAACYQAARAEDKVDRSNPP
jgi:hypothetical protein